MGAMKQRLIEEMELAERLCIICEDRHRTESCWRCGELILCNWCVEQGWPLLCDYCAHVMHKDD
jgi:hypothetical protein